MSNFIIKLKQLFCRHDYHTLKPPSNTLTLDGWITEYSRICHKCGKIKKVVEFTTKYEVSKEEVDATKLILSVNYAMRFDDFVVKIEYLGTKGNKIRYKVVGVKGSHIYEVKVK